ncbi:hypothetical protein DY000_02017041 [Brassica cretica]|uniref:Secreted protein n=1 Tax=Brassica cretica TaxID=69181 RepID=A0ABQ7CTT6_BRACR|nr:hypothetical protein DY000_02017041 [Brassica cretica]
MPYIRLLKISSGTIFFSLSPQLCCFSQQNRSYSIFSFQIHPHKQAVKVTKHSKSDIESLIIFCHENRTGGMRERRWISGESEAERKKKDREREREEEKRIARES